jgi:hypothetical protein
MDNPCKHPIIVLKDIRGWEVQCIVDFMYKGETSVPEAQLTGLIKAAESLKVRGLTSSDQLMGAGGLHHHHHSRYDSPSPAGRYHALLHHLDDHHPPHSKLANMGGSSTDQASPMSLTTEDRDQPHRSPSVASSAAAASAASGGPRRKQARPRRRSGDSVGTASLDLSKADSPHGSLGLPAGGSAGRKTPSEHSSDEAKPENLSMKRPSSSPAINLVRSPSKLALLIE